MLRYNSLFFAYLLKTLKGVESGNIQYPVPWLQWLILLQQWKERKVPIEPSILTSWYQTRGLVVYFDQCLWFFLTDQKKKIF